MRKIQTAGVPNAPGEAMQKRVAELRKYYDNSCSDSEQYWSSTMCATTQFYLGKAYDIEDQYPEAQRFLSLSIRSAYTNDPGVFRVDLDCKLPMAAGYEYPCQYLYIMEDKHKGSVDAVLFYQTWMTNFKSIILGGREGCCGNDKFNDFDQFRADAVKFLPSGEANFAVRFLDEVAYPIHSSVSKIVNNSALSGAGASNSSGPTAELLSNAIKYTTRTGFPAPYVEMLRLVYASYAKLTPG